MYGTAKPAQGTNGPLQSESPLRHADRLVLISALLVSVTAIAVLFGWAFNIESLKGVLPGLAAMKVNSALCFLLGSGPLFATLIWKRGPVQVLVRQALSVAVAAIGGATLLEHLLGIDLGIDQLLATDTSFAEGTTPGRMPLLAALCFILYGIAMTLPGRYTARYDRISTGLLAVGLLGATLALIGHAYHAILVYQLAPAADIGISTAVTFVIMFVGGFATRSEAGWLAILRSPRPGGMIARRFLPAVLLLPPLLGWIALQGAEKGLYGAPFAMALFAAFSLVVFTAIVWQGATAVEALDLTMRSRDRLNRRILETSLDAFILMDDEGRVVEWNPQAERVFGWSRAEAVGQKVGELVVPPDQRESHVSGLARYLATGEEKLLNGRMEVIAWRRDGTEFPAELMIVPIQMNNRWLFSGFVRDVSERKATESQLIQAQKMDAVGQLTGGLAHDFNNMLTVFFGNLDVLEERAAPNLQPQIELMQRASERTASLIDRLLAFSRRKPLMPESLDLNHLVSEMFGLLQRTLGADIEIVTMTDPNLRAVVADRAQVEAAILNLALNARDAMPDGGKLTIETGSIYLDEGYAAQNSEVVPGDYALVAVSDTGRGMPAEVSERAFEPFFTTKEVGKGSGLGLSMVYGFAKQSHGHVKIYSEEGHGTTVRLYLPSRTEGRVAERRPRSESASQLGGGETILAVEDDPLVRDMVVRYLSELGYQVIEAPNGQEALEVVEGALPIDLIFTDVVMPGGMTGRQLIDKATKLRPGIKSLYTSGYTENSIVHHGRLDPGVEFLSKPYKQWDLALRIREILDRKR